MNTTTKRNRPMIPRAAHDYAVCFSKLRNLFAEVAECCRGLDETRASCAKALADVVADTRTALRVVGLSGNVDGDCLDVAYLLRYKRDLTIRTDLVSRLIQSEDRLYTVGDRLRRHVEVVEGSLGKVFALKLVRFCYRRILCDGHTDVRSFMVGWKTVDPGYAKLVEDGGGLVVDRFCQINGKVGHSGRYGKNGGL